MKLLFLIGDSAVGKMTVGQELMKITGLRLFHNHMMIEPVIEIFGELKGGVVARLRDVIFEAFAASQCEGLIFTVQMAFDMPSDWEYLERVKAIFAPYGTQFFYVELVAPQHIRLERNATANRLAHKASKRDVERSNRRLLDDDARHRCESLDGEIPFENFIKIDNSTLAPDATAEIIKQRFAL